MSWILVVDDDVSTRDTVRFVLEDAGYHVLEAADGHAALAILTEAAAPLVALIDLLMPGMDGVDLLRSILADARLATRHRYIGMTAAVGHPTLRLIRARIGPWALGDLAPGELRQVDRHALHRR